VTATPLHVLRRFPGITIEKNSKILIKSR